SDEQALDTALGFEKNSILFYSEMEKLVREQDRKVIGWVIDQEKSHVTRILDLKKMLKSPDIQDYGH
ncbi:MAG: hypothetical protein AB1603_07415, partial [Chloroflexota bacterium]